MRKIIALLFALIFVFGLSSCGARLPSYDTKNSPEIEYESDVLYARETPRADICWRTEFRSAPPKNSTDHYYNFYANIGIGNIVKDERTRAEKVGYETLLLDTLDISKKEFKKKYGISPTLNESNCFFFEDRTIFVVYGETSEKVESGYRRRTVLAEEHNGKIYTHYFDEPYTQNEYIDLTNQCNVKDFPAGNGRIGDMFYLSYRYYDLNTHKVGYYNGNTCDHDAYENTHSGYFSLCEDPVASKYFSADDYEDKRDVPDNGLGGKEVDGRKYFLFATYNQGYIKNENGEEEYRCNELYFVMTDASTNEVLYIEKFTLNNYSAYNAFECAELYMNKNGKLYEFYK